jgi:hypothetical protein
VDNKMGLDALHQGCINKNWNDVKSSLYYISILQISKLIKDAIKTKDWEKARKAFCNLSVKI